MCVCVCGGVRACVRACVLCVCVWGGGGGGAIIPTSVSVKLKYCIALTRLQGYCCMYLCELCRIWLYRDRTCGLIGCCVCPVNMFNGMIAIV